MTASGFLDVPCDLGRIDDTAAFCIAHLVLGVIYHADRCKEKCGLRRKATGFVEWEDQIQTEIELIDASGKSHRICLREKSVQSDKILDYWPKT